MNSYTDFETFREKSLKNPKIKQAYDELEPEFKLISMMIEKRIKENLTQAELAKKLGTKQSAISRFESGTYNPSLAFLRKLAKGLGAELKISITPK